MIQHHDNGLTFYTFDTIDSKKVVHGIFSRRGGVSQAEHTSLNLGGTVGDDPIAVLENHHRVFSTMHRAFQSRFDVWQVHGKDIIIAKQPRDLSNSHMPADGIFTANSEVTLIMRFADCVPLVFFDPVKQVVGVVHAGWMGTLQKIAAEAVKVVRETFDSQPEDVIVGIGPSICQDCYQVGTDVAEKFTHEFGELATEFVKIQENGQAYLDLWKANEIILRNSGVQQIEISGICTAHHLDEWYSHRAEGGKTGRFGVLVALAGT